MRRLIVSTFASLDGIMQAPGGPEEDPTGGFTLGGWMFNYGDEAMDISAAGLTGRIESWCLGRRTYEIFESYWPYLTVDYPIARTLNAAKKYVASRTLTTSTGNNLTLLHDHVPANGLSNKRVIWLPSRSNLGLRRYSCLPASKHATRSSNSGSSYSC